MVPINWNIKPANVSIGYSKKSCSSVMNYREDDVEVVLNENDDDDDDLNI